MRAKLVVFPIRGRKWCFTRSIDNAAAQLASAKIPSSIKELWKNISSNSQPFNANAELLVEFVAQKMNNAWIGLGKAPEGTLKSKFHGLGLRLLSRVKPSEIFLKSISKDVTAVQVTYPSSLNPQLVRRRLRHIAMSGTIIHRKYMYGSLSLLPLTTPFMVLPIPVPNVPLLWILFRAYSHWRALQGSEKLLLLISDQSQTQNCSVPNAKGNKNGLQSSTMELKFEPSKELEETLGSRDESGSLSESAMLNICKSFNLNKSDAFKYRDSV